MVSVDVWNERVERAGHLSAQLAQLHADLVVLTGDLLADSSWAGDGVRSPEHWLHVYTGLSPAQARHLVRVAERRSDLPTTTRMMAEGRLSLDQAAVIARAVPAEAEQAVAEMAETLSVTQVARVASRHHFEREQPRHEEPRTPPSERAASLSMKTSNGRFTLRFETDVLDGALVEQAIREAKDALFTAGNPSASLADGLVEVASRSLASIASPARRDHYRIQLHLDTDQRAWIGKRGAIPGELARRVTCGGQVVPIWESEGTPVSVGRSQRIVPERTRRLVEDRDGGCRYPGCNATGHVENHHLVHWNEGGATDIDQLLSLCPHHHAAHHRGEFTISGTPTTPDGLVFANRHGLRIGKFLPQKPLPPSRTLEGTERTAHQRRRLGVHGAARGERVDHGSISWDTRSGQTRVAKADKPPPDSASP